MPLLAKLLVMTVTVVVVVVVGLVVLTSYFSRRLPLRISGVNSMLTIMVWKKCPSVRTFILRLNDYKNKNNIQGR